MNDSPGPGPGTEADDAAARAEVHRLVCDALEAGRHADAEAAARTAVLRWAGDPEWLDLLALILHTRGRMRESAECLRDAINAGAADAGMYKKLGAVLAAAGEPEQAAQAFLTAARRLPSEAEQERSTIAHLIRANLHDDYVASQATLVGDAHMAVGPLRIRLESASACNLRCQHCPTGVNYDGTDRGIMKADLFEHVIGQMRAMPTLRECVLYLGGEPLMNKHLVRMCQRVKRETTVKRTFITTNGMLLDEKRCAGLALAQLNQIFVSIDGRSPEENDAIRVRARYTTIVEGVKRLQRHLAGTDTQIIISHCMIRRPEDPPDVQTPQFISRDLPGIPIWSDYATRWPGFDTEKSNLGARLAPGEHRNFCAFPFFELAVRGNGDVVLCCHDLLGESVMGNVFDATLAEIWNAAGYRELRRHMLARDSSGVHEVCRRCFIFTGERIVRETPLLESDVHLVT